jgi:hypothetical protein
MYTKEIFLTITDMTIYENVFQEIIRKNLFIEGRFKFLLRRKISRKRKLLNRVIHKSLRYFRPLRYSSRDGNTEGTMSTEGELIQVSVLSYRCTKCASLMTRQMSIL